jgi:TolB-like protein/Tfp pilus assembly protein PilF
MLVASLARRAMTSGDAPPDGDKAAADHPAAPARSPAIMAPVPVIPTPPGEPSKKKKKKAGKVKSAWIAFVGRILAQVIGAAASVIFGIAILQKYQSSGRESTRAAAPAAQTQAAAVRARRSPGETALAVLPLANFSGDAKQEYFADGLTDALTANLAQMRNVRVISRTSAMAYKGLQKPLTEIARELNVDLLVEGSVVRDGERVRVTAQLIDGATDEHLWARSFDRTTKNVLALQDDIAHAIAAEVGEAARPPTPALVDPVVYDLYLRGRFAWNARTPAGFDEAEKFFKQAIAKDPNFALGYAGLADVYQLAGQTGTAASTQQARAAARRALEIDESVAEAHTSLAGLLHRTDADVKGAEREFRRAIALNANYATAHQWFAILLAEEGRDQEAMAHAQRAIALDPLAAPMYQTLALVHYYGRRFDDAMAASRRAIESAPQLPLARDLLARAAIAKGTPEIAGDTARPDTVLAQLNTQRPRPLAALALWHAAADHRDRAFEALGDLVARSPAALQPLKNDPLFDPLRSDPRFAELVQRAAARLESKS